MGQDPDTLRREVAQTRERMGETIEALGYKADVRTRAKENISGKVDTVKERLGMATGRMSDATGTVGDKMGEMTPDAQQVKHGARRAAGLAQENPLGLAIGAAAAGFLAGLLAPGSRMEDEKLGPMADQVKEQVRQTGEEALEHGRQVAGTVREEAQEHGRQIMDSARQEAQEHGRRVAEQTREHASQTTHRG